MNGWFRHYKPAIYALFWIAVIIFAYGAAFSIGIWIAGLIGVLNNIGNLLLQSLLLIGILAVVIWSPRLVSQPRATLKDIGINDVLRWRDMLLGIIGFFVYAFIMTLVGPLVRSIGWFNVDQPQQLGYDGMSGGVLFVGFVVLVIITPIVEEILFRGILQTKLRDSGIPFIIVALLVGVLFAAAHGQWNVAVDVFFMSLVSSYLREKTGRLWPSIFVHIIKNTLAFYVTFVVVAGTIR